MSGKKSPHPAAKAFAHGHNSPPVGSETTIAGPGADQPQAEEKRVVDEPPDGGYGWVCVVCTFFINAHTWGINSSYGVFLAYYLANDYYPGASALEFAFVGGLSISQVRICPSYSFLYDIEIELQDMFGEQEDLSTPETCLASLLPTLSKQC